MLEGKVTSTDAEIKEHLGINPPYALKLSHHGFPDETLEGTRDTNGWFAIMRSYARLPVYHNIEKRHHGHIRLPNH